MVAPSPSKLIGRTAAEGLHQFVRIVGTGLDGQWGRGVLRERGR